MLGCEAFGFPGVAFFGLPLVSFIFVAPVEIGNAPGVGRLLTRASAP